MKEDALKKAIIDFASTNATEYKKSFTVSGNADDIYTVTISKATRWRTLDSVSMEARANTISALPAGSACSCCGGSGRSK